MPSTQPILHVAHPPDRPLMVFDGDCLFCKRWISRWQGLTQDRIAYEPNQIAAARFPEVPPESFQRAVHLIEPDGTVSQGARAVLRSLSLAGQYRLAFFLYRYLPGFALVTEVLYRFVARHRNLMDKLDMIFIGKHTTPSTYFVSRFIFLRLLGVVFLIAFLSLWSQIDGLIGSQGILPIQPLLDLIHTRIGAQGYAIFPTLLWFNGSDGALHFLCGGGVALSILLILGIAPIPVLTLLWACYLSLAVAGQAFLGFQWDVLLLEAGFTAMFFAPWSLIPRRSRETPVPFIGLWLVRWLLFRVMFLSGVLKLTSGDINWRNLTAMQYHYFTQPIPTWTSWYFHNMPAWFQTAGALFMFYAELAAPLMIFGPRRIRLLGFWSIMLLQLLIAATGNFGFFNVLTMVLCISLLDDNCFPRRLRCNVRLLSLRHIWRWQWIATVPLALVILVISSLPLINSFNWYPKWPAPIAAVEGAVAPFRTINGYGLFRVMTTERNEIDIEGSDDQQTWLSYSFKWKPCDTKCAPAFCTPHMPRLDWQMWFASLGGIEDNQWLVNLGGRLLEGSKPVLALLDHNPFPNHPPKYIRFQFYKYTFTDPATRKATGAWWNRELLGPYWSGILSKRTAEITN